MFSGLCHITDIAGSARIASDLPLKIYLRLIKDFIIGEMAGRFSQHRCQFSDATEKQPNRQTLLTLSGCRIPLDPATFGG
jgi:hypothetical protein